MSLFRPEVAALHAYTMREDECRVKVNQNEAPWDWPAEIKAEAGRLAAAVAYNRYPPFDEESLTAALARRWSLAPASVLVGNGSNELLQALFLSALGPGRTVLLPSPSFSLYRQLALLCSAAATPVPLQGSVSYHPETWIEAVRREQPALVLLCSPNNPTGAVFPAEALPELVREAPGLVAVDEAYAEFAQATARSLLPEAENLVVLRTFSKAWAGAGLRLGYLMAAPATAGQVRKALLPYNVSAVTAGLGALALRHAGTFDARVRTIVEERDRLHDGLRELRGVTVYRSQANFILVRLADGSATDVYTRLKRRGVLVRDVSHMPGLERCLRLSVGSREENDAVLAALREVLA